MPRVDWSRVPVSSRHGERVLELHRVITPMLLCRCWLSQISRYPKIALADVIRVFPRRRPSTSTGIHDQNLHHGVEAVNHAAHRRQTGAPCLLSEGLGGKLPPGWNE